jgi:hypothetical protein
MIDGHHPIPVRLALALASGRTIDVPDDLIPAILTAEATINREARKWTAKMGPGGRLIVIDPDLVDRVLGRWPEINR